MPQAIRGCDQPLSERQPLLFLGELHVARIDPEPQPRTDPDRDQHHIAAPQIAGMQAADEIGLPLARAKALEDVFAVVKVIDQHESAAGIGPGIETDVAEWRGRMIEEAAQRQMQTMTHSASLGYAQVAPSLHISTAPVPESYATVSSRPADTQVEVIGVYESANGRHGSGVHLPGVIDVDVRRSKLPLTLVLTSYEPITWKLHRQPGANIKQVLVSSYHPSTVEGTGKAKVIVINAGYNYQASGRRPLSGDVRSLTGATDGLFQGTYSGARFSVGDN